MRFVPFLLSAVLFPASSALACDKADAAEAAAHAAAAGANGGATADPTHCATKAALVGANCSWSTGTMAQRVLEEGKPWTYTGSLDKSENILESRVAAPFTVGPDQDIFVVANAVLDQIDAQNRLTLEGRKLEVDGVHYFVATNFAVPST